MSARCSHLRVARGAPHPRARNAVPAAVRPAPGAAELTRHGSRASAPGKDLVATLKERGALVSKIDTTGGEPPAKSKCLTGREEACK